MSTPSIPSPEFAANAWKQSGESWQRASEKALRGMKTLILSGHGISLKVERGCLLVWDGMTHHPQEPRSWTLWRGIHGVERIVIVDPTGMVTFDAFKWCASQKIAVFVLYDEDGDLAGFSSIGGTAQTDVAVRRAQYEAAINGKALSVARWLVLEKSWAQVRVLGEAERQLWTVSASVVPAIETALERLKRYLPLIESARSIESLRQIEAKAAAEYYGAFRELPIRWAARDKKLVPEHWLTIGGRMSGMTGKTAGPRYATTPANAIRNLAFTYLVQQCRLAAAVRGLDVACGWLHADREYRDSLAYDLMEPLRPAVDEKVIELVTSAKFTYGDFVMTKEGQVRLHPALAKFVVATCCIPWKSIDLSPVIRLLVG